MLRWRLPGCRTGRLFVYTRTLGAPPEVDQTTVTLAYPYQAYTVLNATGYVVAQRKASVASKATGRLEWLGVAEGSRVKQRRRNRAPGECRTWRRRATRPAPTSRSRGPTSSRRRPKWKTRNASSSAARTCWRRTSSRCPRYDTAVARADKARAAFGQCSRPRSLPRRRTCARARSASSRPVIRAPFDGVVLTKNANVGDTITPFSAAIDTKGAVVTMADMSTLEVEADVSESNLHKVKVGQPCEIELDAVPDVRFQGSVSRMVPTVDRSKATVMTKISFRALDPRILPRHERQGRVPVRREVPGRPACRSSGRQSAAAIVEREGRSMVFVVRDDKVSATVVQTRAQDRRPGRGDARSAAWRQGRAPSLRQAAGRHGCATGQEVALSSMPCRARARSSRSDPSQQGLSAWGPGRARAHRYQPRRRCRRVHRADGDRRARARARCSISSPASTSPTAAACASMASTSRPLSRSASSPTGGPPTSVSSSSSTTCCRC